MQIFTSKPIVYWNRQEDKEEVEQVYGDRLVSLLYGNPLGRKLADEIFCRRTISQMVGWYQSSAISQRKIDSFIRQFKIPMEEYEPGPFRSFNDFFIRRFRPGTRKFVEDKKKFPAFVEGRILAFKKVDPLQTFPVKGEDLRADTILGDTHAARPFMGGPAIIARLCPTDYHRFHFPDSGIVKSDHHIQGRLHSVNPVALMGNSRIFRSNERHVSLLETENFGLIAYVEVGALCVGRIVQTHPWSQPFKRGDEKGYFLFGGSTVIIFGEPGKWSPDPDILERSAAKMETYVKLGEAIGSREK